MAPASTETAIVIGVSGPNQTVRQMKASLAEMQRLIGTAGGVVVAEVTQAMRKFDSATLIGPGKVTEIQLLVKQLKSDVVVVDHALSPAQHRNLERELACRVIDRTGIILDIFALHAKSRAGKLQVEYAQLAWKLPQLAGHGVELGQQVGGYIGMRGPGETKLEIDKRRIRERMTRLKRELAELGTQRRTLRVKREAMSVPLVALVGYTNAGKSTLMNQLTAANTLVADQLFATLDPLVRRLKLSNNRQILLADTVGFIRNLPHELVEAFQSTFEEVSKANLLLHVVDASSSEATQQFVTVREVLWQLKLDHIPSVVVANKSDLATIRLKIWGEDVVAVSAKTGEGIHRLLRRIGDVLLDNLTHLKLRIPYSATQCVPQLYEQGRVLKIAYRQKWVSVEADVPATLMGQFKPFVV